jgi:hypothetical protein
LIIGASVIFLAGVGTTIWWLSRNAPKSQPIAAAPTPSAQPTPPPPPPPKPEPPPLAPLPDQVVIHLSSKPQGAKITDLASQRILGKTPLTFRLAGSRDPRQFGLSLRGYGDAVIELVPNRERIEHTEELEKGAVTHVARVPDPTKPAAGSAATPTHDETGSGEGSDEQEAGTAAAGSGAKPGMALPATGETKPGETKPATTKPAETKPAATKPAETKPTPTTTKPAETKPAPTTTKPAETKPAATTTKPAETKSAPTTTKPAETKATATTKPAETKPATK